MRTSDVHATLDERLPDSFGVDFQLLANLHEGQSRLVEGDGLIDFGFVKGHFGFEGASRL